MDSLGLSPSAPLLFQTVGMHGKIGGAIESMFLEASCLKHTAALVMARLSTSTPGLAGWSLVVLLCTGMCQVPYEEDRHVCKCVCKSILPQSSSCALLVNVSGLTLGW